MSTKFLKNERQQLTNALGTELCWGWSPAIDFTGIIDAVKAKNKGNVQARSDDHTASSIDSKPKESKPETEVPPASTGESKLDAIIRELRNQKIESNSSQSGTEGGATLGTPSEEVHILLCGAADIRHILRTLASLKLNETKDGEEKLPLYHFYFYEPNLRVHCRHLFFLQWLVDSMFSLDELEERVLMFLDIYGNACTRDSTASRQKNVTQKLIKELEKEEGSLFPFLDFTNMKSKEKDFLEQQVRFWVKDQVDCRIESNWTQRMRDEMADRYDNRSNIFDWDFVFRVTDYTNLIKFQEYRTWRDSGIAFDASHINPRRGFTYNYTAPNKTLCHFDRRGAGTYLGDIENGPFFSFGAQTGNEKLRARTTDGTCKYGNGVVTMHNVRAWLFTLMTGKIWPWGEHLFAWDDEANYNYLPKDTPQSEEYIASFPSRVRFHFVGLDLDRLYFHLKENAFSSKGKGTPIKFDAAFMGVTCTQFLTPAFFESMNENGVVIAETAKFVARAEDEGKTAFVEKIIDFAKKASWGPDESITAALHKDQPKPKETEGTESKAQKLYKERFAMPYQIALTKKIDA